MLFGSVPPAMQVADPSQLPSEAHIAQICESGVPGGIPSDARARVHVVEVGVIVQHCVGLQEPLLQTVVEAAALGL